MEHYHIILPSGCMTIMVHVVKRRQHSAYVDAPIAEIWLLRLTLGLEGDKSRCFNHRDEFDSAVQLPI